MWQKLGLTRSRRPCRGRQAHADHRVLEGRAEPLLALARGLERVVLALAHALVQAPRDDRGEAGRGHEGGVDPRPLPGMGDRVGVVEDRVAAERRPEAVMDDHVEGREQERDPVLVQRQQRDHHEEVEVRLDVAARDVHDERGGRQQAGGDDRRAQLAPVGVARADRGERDRHRVQQRVPDRIALDEAEDEQSRRVQPQDGEHPPVALLPALVGQRLTLGQHVAEAAHTHTPPSADVLSRLTRSQSACANDWPGLPLPFGSPPSRPSATSRIGA